MPSLIRLIISVSLFSHLLTVHANDLTTAYKTAPINYQHIFPGTNARSTWKQNKISNYVYTLTNHCYCDLAKVAQVFVINNKVVKVLNSENGQKINGNNLHKYKTIEQLFTLIDKTLKTPADKIAIDHDRYLGYPSKIFIDPSKRLADDEINLSASNFKLLIITNESDKNNTPIRKETPKN